MPDSRSADETARLGGEIYEQVVRPQVESQHHGDYVAIDVRSGCWALADDLRAAAKRLRAQQPDAVDVCLLRVGYRTLHHLGAPATTRPLVGMSLLMGSALQIDVEPGGRVVIDHL